MSNILLSIILVIGLTGLILISKILYLLYKIFKQEKEEGQYCINDICCITNKERHDKHDHGTK